MTQDLNPQQRRDLMYGEHDLGSMSLFSGSFINYGYWSDRDPDLPISLAERTESQAELYRQVVSQLAPSPEDLLLELGSGLGVGAAMVSREFDSAGVRGMDRSDAQLERARKNNAELMREQPERLSFHKGSVTEIPWPDETFGGVYAVEMLQHVDDRAQTAREAWRVLRPGGRFATATFFAPDGVGDNPIAKLIETVESGIDVIRPVGEFADALDDAGFADVKVTSIGDRVWRQFDQWVGQTEFHDSWGRNWLRCYENGWIDYFLVTAGRV